MKFYISYIIKNKIRLLKQSDCDSIGLSKFGDDISFTDLPVTAHVDNTKPEFDTIICVLVNDGNYKFIHGGKKHNMPPGKMIRFDGNIEHEVKGKSGRFAFIIWDVPVEKHTTSFISQIGDRLMQLLVK